MRGKLVFLLCLISLVNPFEFLVGNLLGVTLGRIFGVFALLLWLVYLQTNSLQSYLFVKSKIRTYVFFFAGAAVISSATWIFEENGFNALTRAITFLLLGLLALMVENTLLTKKNLIYFLGAMLIAGSIASIPSFLFNLGYDIYSFFGEDAPQDLTIETLRASNLGGNPNSLGIQARNGLFAGLLLLTFISKNKNILYTSILTLICFSGIFLSGSRTNFFGVVIMLLVASLFVVGNMKRLKFVKLILFTFLSLYVIFLFTPVAIRGRIFALNSPDNEELYQRASQRLSFVKNQQNQAFEFWNDYPVFGVGLGRTNIVSSEYSGAHDTVSCVVGELGLIGTLTFLLLIAGALHYILKDISRFSDRERIRLAILFGSLVAMLVMGVRGGLIMPYDRAFWITIGLIGPLRLTFSEKA